MKKVGLILACLLLLISAGLVGASCSDDEETVSWKLATYSLSGTLQTDLLQDFADKVEEMSDGKMTIKVDTTLYTMSEIYDAVSDGLVEMGFAPDAYAANQAPVKLGIMAYSNMLSSDIAKIVELNRALVEGVDAIQQEAAADDIKHVMWLCTGSADFYSKDPVTDLAGLDGLKIGCSSGVSQLVSALGGSPVTMEMMEIYQNAQQGVIDAFLMASTEELYLQGQLYTVLPCITVLHVVSAISAFINEPAFEDLPEDLQDIVLAAASEIEDQGVQDYKASWQTTLQTLEDNADVNVVELTDDQREQWFDTILPVMYGVMQYYASAEDISEAEAIIADVMG